MATTNTNFKVKNGLDAGGNLTTTAGLQVGTTATVNGNFTTYGTSTLHANQQLSLAVRNGANYTGNILQYSLNDSTVTGGRTARGLLWAGSTGFENNNTYNLSATNPFLTSSTATFTVSTVQTYNPFAAGQKIIVSGASQAQYNGSWITTAVGGSSGAWTVTIVAPGTTTPFTNGGALTATGTIAVEPAGFFKQPHPGAVGLTIKGAGVSGTATTPFRYIDSAGNLKTYIDASGDFVAPAISAIWSITSSAQDVTVNAIRARHSVANYRANLQTWENASTVLAGVNAQGQFFTGSTTPIQGSTTVAINTHTPTGTTDISVTTASNHGISVGQTVVVAGITPAGYNGTWVARAGTTGTTLVLPIGSNPGAITVAGTVTQNSQVGITAISAYNTPLVVRAAGSHQANIFEAQRSTPDTVFRIRNNGQFGSGSLLTGTNAWINNDILGSTVGLIIRGASGQSADLLQIQNNTPSTLFKVDQNGFLVVGGSSVISNALISATAYGTTQVGVAIRGASGQTANLQEWQTSTPTTVASVSASGSISATGSFTTPSTTFDLINTTATTINFAGAATTLTVGGATGGTTTNIATGTNGSTGTTKTIQIGSQTIGTAATQLINIGNVTSNSGTSTINIGSTGSSTISLTGNTTLTGDLILAAGSASVEPIRFQVNSVAPTATSGAMDYDGDKFYAVTSGTATGRLMIPAIARVFSNANATAATTNSSQSIFQAGARALTLEADKTYYFRLNLGVNFTFSAVPAAIQLVPTFSQTPVAINYSAVFASGTSGGVQSFRTTSTSAVSVSPTLSASVTGATILVEGFFRSNATTGGTVEFKYQISTGGGSSATAQTGSFLQIEKIGTGTPGIISGAWA